MTYTGGRNPFRKGYCGPEDIQHNMRMLSQLHDDLGNPVPGFPPEMRVEEGGPGPLVSPLQDDIPSRSENTEGEELAPPNTQAMVRFSLVSPLSGGSGPATLLDSSGQDTLIPITVHDPLDSFSGAAAGDVGWGQARLGSSTNYDIVSLGEPVNYTLAGEGDGTVRMCAGGDLNFLSQWLPNKTVVGYKENSHQKVYFAYEDATYCVLTSVYTDKPEATDELPVSSLMVTKPSSEPGIHSSWWPPSSLDEKVRVIGGDTAPGYLWSQFTAAVGDYGDVTAKLPSDGENYDESDHDAVNWNQRKTSGGDYAMLGFTVAGMNLIPGVTKTAVTEAVKDGVKIAPGAVGVDLYEMDDDKEHWIKKTDDGASIVAKVWAFKTMELGHPVMVGRDRTPEKNWWVVWFPCDKVPEE